MDNIWLTAAIVLVPLLAGLALIVAMARGILDNPGVPNINAMVLGIAALLCVAPTILNLAITLPGGTTISLVREELQSQTRQIKSDFGAQGAYVKRELADLRRRIDALETGKSPTTATAAEPQSGANSANSSKVVVVLYYTNKDLAQQIEDYLLQQGYSANAVYTDFTELGEGNLLPAGTVAFVSTESSASLRGEVEKILRAKFTQLQKVTDSSSSKIVGTAVQVRLF
jgi:hypothetical protein